MERNDELRLAWDFVENTGRSIFLTGKAGTGKTTFLKTVVEKSRKRPIVVAPTGVAAINAGGVTIHSFFQLPFTPYVPGAKMESKFEFSREKRKILASIDLLIIDEISMVRADLLDAIDSVLRRFRDHLQPFGGVQLLKPYYYTPYFFGSKALGRIEYVTIQLQHVYRQQDDSFIDILNQIRDGRLTQENLAKLNGRYQPHFIPKPGDGYIRLTTHNHLANYYNETELRKLSSRTFQYKASIEGTYPDYSYPTAETLELKVGAQVMFVKNDPSTGHLYYNGRIGQVVYLDNSHIKVRCEGDDDDIEVEALEWENTRYTLNEKTREIEAEVQGTFRQYPLRLAWAITIHKSQGLTFDHAIIEANQSFSPGQVYVALSRCRTMEGLVLAAPLNTHAIINDERVSTYISGQEEDAKRSIQRLPLLKQEYERQVLLQLFDFRNLVNMEESMNRVFAEYFYHSHASLKVLHNQTFDLLRTQVVDVSNKWRTLIQAKTFDELHTQEFLDRVKRSATYFADTLKNLLEKPLRLTQEVKSNNKQAMNRLGHLLPELRQAWLAHRYLLTAMAEQTFTVTRYLKEKQLSMLDALDESLAKPRRERRAKEKTPKEVKPKTWEITYQLFQQGMQPVEIAIERRLAVSTIINDSQYVSAMSAKPWFNPAVGRAENEVKQAMQIDYFDQWAEEYGK